MRSQGHLLPTQLPPPSPIEEGRAVVWAKQEVAGPGWSLGDDFYLFSALGFFLGLIALCQPALFGGWRQAVELSFIAFPFSGFLAVLGAAVDGKESSDAWNPGILAMVIGVGMVHASVTGGAGMAQLGEEAFNSLPVPSVVANRLGGSRSISTSPGVIGWGNAGMTPGVQHRGPASLLGGGTGPPSLGGSPRVEQSIGGILCVAGVVWLCLLPAQLFASLLAQAQRGSRVGPKRLQTKTFG